MTRRWLRSRIDDAPSARQLEPALTSRSDRAAADERAERQREAGRPGSNTVHRARGTALDGRDSVRHGEALPDVLWLLEFVEHRDRIILEADRAVPRLVDDELVT